MRDAELSTWVNHRNAKRDFRQEIRKVQRDFEQQQVLDLVKNAECDRNKLWKMVKNAGQSKQSSTIAIKKCKGKVVHEIPEVVKAWKDHFSYLCSKRLVPKFDKTYFDMVTSKVNDRYSKDEEDLFLSESFSLQKICVAVKWLNRGKAAGWDSVSADHLEFAGPSIMPILARIYKISGIGVCPR